MRAFGTGTKAWLLSSALLFSCPAIVDSAQAAQSGKSGNDALKPTASYGPHAIGSHVSSDGKVSPSVVAGRDAVLCFLRSLCAAGFRY